jgi:hypothetical protein
MADSPDMRRFPRAGLWRMAYTSAVRSSFATVPLYREHWALDGRTDPVLVPGRTGTDGGAIRPATVAARIADLVPLAGGDTTMDPLRGLERVLHRYLPLSRDRTIVVTTPDSPVTGGARVVAVGTEKDLAEVTDPAIVKVPLRELDDLTGDGPHGLLADHQLGVLGGLRDCGRWHLDASTVYARETPAGLAFTLLRQRSPRLVDVLVADGVMGTVSPCPRHGSPVIEV